uniref:Uncharacterized protein n=1 Tax=Oryza nivara TaxID=4536 RepID=A0A0E0FN17_ORYNI
MATRSTSTEGGVLYKAFHPTPCVRAGFAWLREREEKQTSCWADRGKKAGLREREKGNRICTFQL